MKNNFNSRLFFLIAFIAMAVLACGCSCRATGQEQYSPDTAEELEESKPAPYELSLEENLKTRGALIIEFRNTDSIDAYNEILENYSDGLLLYTTVGESYGIVLSTEGLFISTLPPDEYKAYSEFIDKEIPFTVEQAGEVQKLTVDYKTKTYEIVESTQEEALSVEALIEQGSDND